MRPLSKKDIGNYGEKVAETYLLKHGFEFVDRNVHRKTGEIDIIVRKDETLHFVEVKAVACTRFPENSKYVDFYMPSDNLHSLKIKKVVRTAEWYMSDVGWEGEFQIDAVFVWVRKSDGTAKVRYISQIL